MLLVPDCHKVFNDGRTNEQRKYVDVSVITVPTADEVKNALAKDPDECGSEEIAAVTFFYKLPLLCLEIRSLSKKRLTSALAVWDILGSLWPSTMAYAMVLLEKHSDLTNIHHNYIFKLNCHHNGAIKRPKKAKTLTKENMPVITALYYTHLPHFLAVKNSAQNLVSRRARYREWDLKVGICQSPERTPADKRGDAAPVSVPNKKARQDDGSDSMPDLEGMNTMDITLLLQADSSEDAGNYYEESWC